MKEFKNAFMARNVFCKIRDQYEEPNRSKLSNTLEKAFVNNPNAVVAIFFSSKFKYLPNTQEHGKQIFMPCTWFDELVYVCSTCGYKLTKIVDENSLKCNVSYFKVCIDFDCNP